MAGRESRRRFLRFGRRESKPGAHASEGIEIPEDSRLNLGVVRDLYQLLRAIGEAIPPGAILYIEGTSIAPDVRDLLDSRSVAPRVQPTRGTIFPTPARYHLPLIDTNLEDLRQLAERHAEPEVCDHLVVYDTHGVVLLDAYDAGADEVHLNQRKLSPERITRFRELLVSAR